MKEIEKSVNKVSFKRATEKDIPIILDFIKQIAAYEKMLDKVKATEESLRESIFHNNRAEALLIEMNKEFVGYVIYFFNFSTFVGREGIYIEDLYIKPEYRRNGIGKKAFEVLAHIAKENKCERIEWTCLDWNEPSLNFYKSIGAKPMREWIIHRLDNEAIDEIIQKES
ncbi:GCN5-related N-acetyltransferase [Clostridium sp. DL-VIII]|uniref:GNAT family N-acetyltransferase n=1 Tax=Clostridium sp. DL-VIII TaxID=641107 RepID=UPI00023AF065|nr:GNAT family N-acetyltransferase [Clostridium sp. DL-VIII]EHI97521.1 GCN5-related N-acetyltransferase [Clostridium sp. DL-VIII]